VTVDKWLTLTNPLYTSVDMVNPDKGTSVHAAQALQGILAAADKKSSPSVGTLLLSGVVSMRHIPAGCSDGPPQQQLDLALECFEQAAQVNMDTAVAKGSLSEADASLWAWVGKCRVMRQEWDLAAPAFQVALKIKRGLSWLYWHRLAQSHAHAKRNAVAVKCWLEALKVNSDANVCWSLLETGFRQMARPDLLDRVSARKVSLFEDFFNLDGNPESAALREV
jgi:tetratricopeptide (TPR) repeat protein